MYKYVKEKREYLSIQKKKKMNIYIYIIAKFSKYNKLL